MFAQVPNRTTEPGLAPEMLPAHNGQSNKHFSGFGYSLYVEVSFFFECLCLI